MAEISRERSERRKIRVLVAGIALDSYLGAAAADYPAITRRLPEGKLLASLGLFPRCHPDAKRNAWEEGSWAGGKRAAEFALDLASGPAASASAVTLQAELAQNSPETLRGVLARAQAGGYLFARKFSRSCDRMLAIEMARGWPAR